MTAKRLALFPASLDPLHNGHVDVVRRAARIFDEVVVGVYDSPGKQLLFSANERLELARAAFVGENENKSCTIQWLNGTLRSRIGSGGQLYAGCALFQILIWNFAQRWRTGSLTDLSRRSR